MMTIAIILVQLGLSSGEGVKPSRPAFETMDGQTMRYGVGAKSRRAVNHWDRLNLSPMGVAPTIEPKRL